MLEWFNYECPFVKYHYEKANTMVELANKYKDKNVVWLTINSTGHLTTEKNKEFELGYPVLDDRSGKVDHLYGAKTTPHLFIIDAKGNITYNGAIDNSPLGKEESITNTEPYGCSVKYAD